MNIKEAIEKIESIKTQQKSLENTWGSLDDELKGILKSIGEKLSELNYAEKSNGFLVSLDDKIVRVFWVEGKVCYAKIENQTNINI